MYSTQVYGTRLITIRKVGINLHWGPIIPNSLGRGGGLVPPEGQAALICPGAPHPKHGPGDAFIPNNLFIVLVQQSDLGSSLLLSLDSRVIFLILLFFSHISLKGFSKGFFKNPN